MRHRQSLPKHRIDLPTAFLMVGVAIFFDALQIIPKFLALTGVGLVFEVALPLLTSAVGYSWLWLWFQMRNVSMLKGKYMTRRFGVMGISLVLEVLPFSNIIPGTTWWTITNIVITRHEDKEARAKVKEQQKKQEEAHTHRLRAEMRALYEQTRN